jgi:hypothetical protein
VKLAQRGIPAVALVTEAFWAQGDFVARSVGMPDIPRVRLPHPVAGTGVDHMATVADDTVPLIASAWVAR